MNTRIPAILPLLIAICAISTHVHADGMLIKNTPQVDITQHIMTGSHCRLGVKDNPKSGNALVLIGPSFPGGTRDYFQMTFDEFILKPNAYGNDQHTDAMYGDCLVEMDVDVPEGYQISYIRYQIDGSMALEQFPEDTTPNVGAETGEIATSFYLESAEEEGAWIADGRHSIRRSGDFADDVEAIEDIALDSDRCDRKVKLTVYTTTSLESTAQIHSDSYVSVDRSSGNFGQTIRIYLKRCGS